MRERLHFVVLFNLIFRVARFVEGRDGLSDEDGDFGEGLISSLRNDVKLDLSADEEYEDLRAELLAYHTALASLSASQSRRSMMTTPCWELGGICIPYQLCTEGFRYLTEIPGCKDQLNVCCFAWNKWRVKDFRDKGIDNLALPWSLKREFGGKGVIDIHRNKESKKSSATKKNKAKKKKPKPPQPSLEKSKTNDQNTNNDPIVVLRTFV